MPRPQANAEDATARKYLANGWEAIMQKLGYASRDLEPMGPRRDSLSGISDIPILAGIGPANAVGEDTTGAFYRRWRGREEYLADLVRYILATARFRGGTPEERSREFMVAVTKRPPLPILVAEAARRELAFLQDDPSFAVYLQMWSAAQEHGWIRELIREGYDESSNRWAEAYDVVMAMYGLSFRPGVDSPRVAVLLTALLEGLALRGCMDPEAVDDDLFADGVQALLVGLLDCDVPAGLDVAKALDSVATRASAKAHPRDGLPPT